MYNVQVTELGLQHTVARLRMHVIVRLRTVHVCVRIEKHLGLRAVAVTYNYTSVKIIQLNE